jgi:sugar phosphate isomerase/epimerase
MTISRRRFFEGAAAVAAAARLHADPLKMPIGFQSYSVRDLIAKDFAGTMKQMAGMGFRAIEMCSPPGYERAGFGTLTGLSASAMRNTIETAGLKCESCHYQFRELQEKGEERIAFARELGLKQMVVASFGIKEGSPLADWTKAAATMNRIGEQTKKAGIQAAFHNHHGEFAKAGDTLIYDHLLTQLDPALVKLQFQVAVVNIGFHAADYMKKYPGRFVSLHLADWSATEKKTVPIGQGLVDWKKLFAAAKKGGVRNYFVEMNLDLMRDSVPYLRKLA